MPARKQRTASFAHLSEGLVFSRKDLGPLQLKAKKRDPKTPLAQASPVVCVVDTGVDKTWAESSTASVKQFGFPTTGNEDIEEEALEDKLGHGTACASVLSNFVPHMELLALRITSPLGGASSERVRRAIEWALEQSVDVVNLSLSTRRVQARGELAEICDEAARRNVVIVCAANNRPVHSWPWRFQSVVSVGSHSHPDANRFERNPAPGVDFFARGVDVPVSWPGTSKLRRVSGNSFAAPHVSGQMAILRAKYPNAKVSELKTAMAYMADNVA